MLRIAGLLFLFLLVPPAARSQQAPGIRGFTTSGAIAEREREQRFQAVPLPDNLREYMQAIAAEPHHAGSPGSRKVAEYILAKFKSWGLNAAIEQSEALMPFPIERVVELVAPERYTADAQGAGGRGGSRTPATRGNCRRSTRTPPTATSPPISCT